MPVPTDADLIHLRALIGSATGAELAKSPYRGRMARF